MLGSGRPSVRTPLSGPTRTGLRGLLTLCISHLFSKRYFPIVFAHRVWLCVICSLLSSSSSRTPSRTAGFPVQRCAPSAPCSIPCRAARPVAAHRAPSPARAEVLLGCCRHRRSPPKGFDRCRCYGCHDARAQQGDIGVDLAIWHGLTAARPHRRPNQDLYPCRGAHASCGQLPQSTRGMCTLYIHAE